MSPGPWNPYTTLSPESVAHVIQEILHSNRSPSAWELIEEVEKRFNSNWRARWMVQQAIRDLIAQKSTSGVHRQYLESLLNKDLNDALSGLETPRKEVQTGIDSLIRKSVAYRSSAAFRELITFVARFREYAPYNNMLVKVQNPSCSYYATEKNWNEKFERLLKEDARPMLIIAPKHPVLLVYDLDQTEGKELPEELTRFSKFDGDWKQEWLDRTVENALKHYRIRIEFKTLSSTNSGFATIARGANGDKMRIAIHAGLDQPSRYGVVCHEMAHILLGHLGTDADYWWPSRMNLDHKTVEIEAESTAYIVTALKGLKGSSESYVSRHLGDGPVPNSVSVDLIAKASARIEEMGRVSLEERSPRAVRANRGRLF
jgi:hypothetical protein